MSDKIILPPVITPKLTIIHEDNDIIVLSKPAGVLTIPDRYNPEIPNLRSILKYIYGNIFVVHRLDKDTSGIMLFAKNAEAHKFLNTEFEELKVLKVYHCVVSGFILQDEFEIDIPLMPSPSKLGVTIPSARGKESLTQVKVIQRFRNITLIKCRIITGRHHQIRAHLAAVGNPLLVDPIYGSSSEFFLSSIKRRYNLKKHDIENPIISRVTMHSTVLGFIHPTTKEEMQFESDYPKDFKALINVLNKYSK